VFRNSLDKSLSIEICRERASDCREMANLAGKPEHRIMLQHMAETWDRIAADMAKTKNN